MPHGPLAGGLDLTGKRVAVIGNGASAMQLVPAIVDDAEHVYVFQRSPQWAAPFEKFHQPVPETMRWLIRDRAAVPAVVPPAAVLELQRQEPPGAAARPGRGRTPSGR